MATPRARLALLGLAGLAWLAPASLATAQDRPSEEDLFGATAPASPPTPALPEREPAPSTGPGQAGQASGRSAPTSAQAPADPRADDLLGDRDRAAPRGQVSGSADDPLALGGQVYLRATATWSRDVPPAGWPFAMPNLLDVYLDARPNDRVRAFVLGRLAYDPTIVTEGVGLLGQPVTRSQTSAGLDQLYVSFDVDRTVFVTAGKQHVKWGVGKFWNPADWLHPVPRDPLDPFDARLGVTMVKAHLPWEARGWNLSGVLLLEDVAGDTRSEEQAYGLSGGSTLGRVGAGARAEVLVGPAELGADLVAQRGHGPRFGLDASTPLWDLDLHAELALRRGKDAPRWALTPGADPGQLASYQVVPWESVTPAVVVGAEWSANYTDEDALTVGAEYSFDDAGYDSARIYPVLIASPLLSGDPRAAFTPFYVGRHYAGAYLSLPHPGRWNDTTFTLSAIANLSDGSAIVRLDHSVVLNTYLTLETYLAGHLGTEGGEFRFGVTVPPQDLGDGVTSPEVFVPTPVLDAGVALRVRL